MRTLSCLILTTSFVMSFLLAHIILKEVEGQGNDDNVSSNGIYPQDTITDFSGNGLISSLISVPRSSLSEENVTAHMNKNITQPAATKYSQIGNNDRASGNPYILAGFWKLNVDNGTINYFYANFSMVHVNGLRYHTHQIINFEPNVVIPIVFDPQSGGLSFTGMMDIKEGGRVKWIGVQTRVMINGFNTIAIYPDTDYIDHHFQNQPIYGVVQTLKDDRRDTFLVDNFI